MPARNPYVGFAKDRRQTDSLWERFNAGQLEPEQLTDPYVRLLVSEWKRCAKLGVDPTRKIGVQCTEEVFQKHLKENQRLLSIAQPFIDKVTGQLFDVPGIVLLADRQGVILYIAGDPWIRELAASRSGVVEGSCWLESVAGSNGMGSALTKRDSVHVFSSEHFCEGWHTWTCAATPLLDPDDGEPIGVVDFTTIDRDYRDQALALTCSMGQAIFASLKLDASSARNYLIRRYEDLCSRYRAERLVLLDDRGKLVRSGPNDNRKPAVPLESLSLCADAIPIYLPGPGRLLGTAYVVSKAQAQPARPARLLRPGSQAGNGKPAGEVPPAAAERVAGGEAFRLPRPPAVLADAQQRTLASYEGDHQRLLQDAADYQVIFDNAIVGICYSIDRSIARCNRRFEEMFGYEPGELDNQQFLKVYPSEREFRQTGRAIYRHFRTHRVYSDERIMRRKNGELFWCAVSGKRLDSGPRRAIWILQDVSGRKNAEEALQRAHQRLESQVQERTLEVRKKNEALHAEITRRKRTEEKLRENQKKYRVLFETSPVGMLVTDKKGNVVEVNKAMARMIPKADLAASIKGAKSARMSMIHSDGTPMRRSEMADARALREGKTLPEFELGVRGPDGHVRWFGVTGAPIPVESLGAVVAHREVTETKRLEEQERLQRIELARASRMNTMGEMAAAMAHELGQPLSSAVNFLSGCRLRLEGGEYDRDAVYETISQALYYTEQAGDIIKHIRQFIRRHQPNAVSSDLNSLIREMAHFMDIERRQHAATIELNLAAELPKLMLDPLEIKQLMVNLVKNGLEAMAAVPEPERVLSIGTRTKGRRWVEVTVSDRGHGVSADALGNIFNPFFSTKDNGLGLGLVICRSIVESHGGKLVVGSNPKGGATFSFCLPLSRH